MAYRNVYEAGHRISLQWVPDHCDIVGNDQANHTTEVALSYTRTNIALLKGDRQAILCHITEPMALWQCATNITSASMLARVDLTLALQLHVTSLVQMWH